MSVLAGRGALRQIQRAFYLLTLPTIQIPHEQRSRRFTLRQVP